MSLTPIPQMLLLIQPEQTPADVLALINRRREAKGQPPIKSKKGKG